ncbi:MAG: DUF1156 domain-containing protein [Actinomycetota bacterium]|jgi:putative DNA methylase|nr:DUF1156 domain-containing protein [Actinomycetota bacterium]
MTDTPYRKKLVETALPLEAINAACKADKDRKTGTIRNLHKWFAPMPVPALRALIFASLVDDPEDEKERARLMELIEALVASVVFNPDEEILAAAKREISNSVGELPTVLDPFCGGGSTLVEAQRLGLASRGSDLNPIPVLISKTLTELPAKCVGHRVLHGNAMFSEGSSKALGGFFVDVEYYARQIRDEAFQRVGHMYPLAPNGDPVVAWWWARTVESPDPRFAGAQVPLVNDWCLSKKRGEEAYVVPIVNRNSKTITFSIARSASTSQLSRDICLFSGAPIPLDYVRQQAQQVGLGTQMLAIISSGQHGRAHFAPTEIHSRAAIQQVGANIDPVPIPEKALSFSAYQYGFKNWSELFTHRQQSMLEAFAKATAHISSDVVAEGGSTEYARAIETFLGLCVGKLAQASSMLVKWRTRNGTSKAEIAVSRHDISPLLDFAETNPFGGSVGDWMGIVTNALRALNLVDPTGPGSVVVMSDARTASEGLDGQCLVVTDPPYFSAIGYANVSDYFYPWLRLSLKDLYPDLFSTIGAPKVGELIAEPARHATRHDAKQYFIDGFTDVIGSLRAASRPDLPLLIVYAYKEQESEEGGQVSTGWEAMLEAVIRSGLAVIGTWPIRGTSSSGIRDVKANALATYVVLVCRPRPAVSGRISRRDLVATLRTELGPAIQVLQSAAVAPVDLAQAVIGPGMAVFTRYQSVLEPDGAPMTVRSALLLINSVLAEVLDQQEGEFDSDTRWATTWFEQFQFGEAPSGEADSLARAKVTSIDGLERAGVIVTRGGTCRLVRRDELAQDYDPAQDRRPTVWEAVQHLVKQLLDGGEEQAASLLARLPNSEAARDLAYRLYSICERKGWAEEGGAYNVLVASWPEIARLAQQQQTQQQLGSGQLPGLG